MKVDRHIMIERFRAAHRILPCLLFIAVISCVEEPAPSGNALVDVSFQLETTSSMEGKISIHEVYLKLNRLTLTGNSGSDPATSVTESVSPDDPPYRLSRADSAYFHVNLPFRPYSQLELIMYLMEDNHELKFPEDPIGQTPPVDNGGALPDPQGNADDNGSTPDEDGEPADEDEGEEGNPGNDHDGGKDNDDDDQGGHDDVDNDIDDDAGDDDGQNGDADDDDGEGTGDKGGKGDKGDEGDKGGKGDKDDKGDKGGKGQKGDKGDKDTKGDKGDKGPKGDKKDEKKGDKGKGKDKDHGHHHDDGRVAGHTVDLDDFFRNAKPSMVVFGTYQNNDMKVDVIVAVTGIETIVVQAQQDGHSSIVLSPKNSAVVSFNPERWFGSLTPSDIESASQQVYQGGRVLLIHKDFNQALYEKLLSRLPESVGLHIASDR